MFILGKQEKELKKVKLPKQTRKKGENKWEFIPEMQSRKSEREQEMNIRFRVKNRNCNNWQKKREGEGERKSFALKKD